LPVSSTTRSAGPYTGTGTTPTYSFNFKVFASSDVLVQTTLISTGALSTLVLGTDYSVALNGDQNNAPGGSVTLLAGNLASTTQLNILSNLPYTQLADLQNQGGYLPSVIVDALDRLTILVQQLWGRISAGVSVPAPEAGITLPTIAARANALLGFDGSGNPVAVTENVVVDAIGNSFAAGYLGLPQNPVTGAYTLVLADRGKSVRNTTGNFTFPSGVFSPGDGGVLVNKTGSTQNVAGPSITIAGTALTGTRTLANNGICNWYCDAANVFLIAGPGVG
jgi:hypothetical protein